MRNQVEGEDQPKYLEVLNSQYAFLICYLAIDTLTISSGVLINGELSVPCFQFAWKELVSRHPSLRVKFEMDPKAKNFTGYKQKVVDNIVLPNIRVDDIRYLNDSERERYIKEKHEENLNQKFDLFKWPLHNISIIQTAERNFYIIISISHLISDGLGNQQLLRELLSIYDAKISGKNTDLPKPISVLEQNVIVNDINIWNNIEENGELESFLKKQGKKKYFFNPYGTTKNLELPKPFKPIETKTKKYWISETTTEKIILNTRVWHVSLFVLLVSMYLKTIKQIDQTQNNIIINLPTGGKVYPNIDATGVVDAFAQNMALSFNIENEDESWTDLIAKVNTEIKIKLSIGTDRAQILQAAGAARKNDILVDGKIPEAVASIIRSSIKSNIYLSFVGNTNIKKCYDRFEVTDYEAYTCTNPGTIDVLVELFQGKILLTSNYDSTFFDEEYIDKHMSKFIDNINEVANIRLTTEHVNQIRLSPVTSSNRAESELLKMVSDICQREFTTENLDSDIDSELGIDSLERIRLVSKLSKDKKGVDKKSMFTCSTLRQMALLLDNNCTSTNENRNISEILIPYMKIVEQCHLTPNSQAIFFNNQSITYSELEQVTNKLANCLTSQVIGRGSLVGVMTLPGPMMLIGMIGILKTGAAYVPIDPTYPNGRIEYIINHSEINILLTENLLITQVNNLIKGSIGIKNLILLDNLGDCEHIKGIEIIERNAWMQYSSVQPDYKSNPIDLMVVLYTSGSTGEPKGVMLNHLGYMNRLIWHQKTFNLKYGERVAQKTSCCFDISVWELFWPLMYGGTVCPVRKEIVKNPWALAQWLLDTKINIMHFVPSLFGEFVHALEQDDYSFNDLRWLIFSGEALPMAYIQEWIDKHGMATKLSNLYGPTEASIDVTYHIIDKRPGSDGENQIPIGKPVDNVYVLNLDKNMKILKTGEIGELWIGGIQLAKGYFKNTDKTNEAFKPNPFSEIPGDYLYRTGDLTSQRLDGSFEYHGRVDNQVKIRGFRIELGEIETVLSSHMNIDEAAVIIADGNEGQSQLVAYLSGKTTNDSEVKEYIGKKLPYYMIPHRIEWLQCLPKNPNGKLDRKAMKELYNKKDGESEEIESALDQGKKETTILDYKQDEEVYIPLAPAQHWLLNYFDYPYRWNGFSRFLFKQPLDYIAFNKAINMIINRHDALRSILCHNDLQWVLKILPLGDYQNIEYFDAMNMDQGQIDESINELIINTIQSLDVDKWPLWKIAVVKVSDGLFDIVVIGHHLISDVVTNNLLFKEIWQIYYHILLKEEIKLPMPRSYREFVENIESEKEKNIQEYINYWNKIFPTKNNVFRIPTDFSCGTNNEGSAESSKFVLEKKETSVVLSKAKKVFGSNVYSILLAPLYKMLAEQYGQSKVVVSHRVHGRSISDTNTFFQTVGDFAVNFPLGLEINQDDDWVSLVSKIRDKFEEIPLKGISYDVASDNLPAYMYPDTKLTPIRANYLGNRNLPKLENFEFSADGMDRRYSLPEQKRISIIEFFFSIVEGRLILEIEFSNNLFNSDTIQQLGEKYIEAIKNLVSFVEDFENKVPHSIKKIDGMLSDKVVIITGGGSSIGKGVALAMAREGAHVVIVSKNKEGLEEAVFEAKKYGINKPYTIIADVSKVSDANMAVDKVIKEYGKVDILVNSADHTKLSDTNDIDPNAWKKIVEINLFGTYNFCRAVIPHFKNQSNGKIINISSDSSFIGYPSVSAYAASKHAILGLTKSLAEELKLYNIQINAICPELADNDMAQSALRDKEIPPEKIADTAIFFASSMSDLITGEAIKVYGKQDMYCLDFNK